MTYRIEFLPRAARQLDKLPHDFRLRIRERVNALADDPRPHGVVKLRSNRPDLYRIRIGDYRVVYQIRDEVLLVLVVEVGHRSQVYREF
jgi:mRNA interferase RelE/StbE